MSALRLVFHGDDFTGATDALEVLSLAGLKCALFLQLPDAATLAKYRGLDAIGIAGDSRTMSPQDMDAQLPPVLEALAAAGAPLVHYKVCSTFDSSPATGSIGRVIELARRRFAGAVPVVAATPHLGRHCLFGNLFARSGTDGQVHRLDRHPIMSVHPVTPMHEADLALHLQRQAKLEIAKITLDQVRAGAQAMQARFGELQQAGADAVLVDGFDAADMEAAGRMLLALGRAESPAFVVGGSGVEHALALAWQLPRDAGVIPAVRPLPAGAPVLALSGSASALSAIQIDEAVRSGYLDIPLDTAKLADERLWQAEADRACSRATQAMAEGRSVILHSARGPDDPRVAASLQVLAAQDLAGADARHAGGRLLASRLGRLLLQVTQAARPARILISGGDTSSSIARALDIQAVEVAARLAPGAPLCRVLESRLVPGAEVAFKGGQMGSRNFFDEARHGASA